MPLPTVYPDEKLAVLQRKMKLRPPCHVWELFWFLLQEFSAHYPDQQEKNWSTVKESESTWLCGFCLNAFYSHVSFIVLKWAILLLQQWHSSGIATGLPFPSLAVQNSPMLTMKALEVWKCRSFSCITVESKSSGLFFHSAKSSLVLSFQNSGDQAVHLSSFSPLLPTTWHSLKNKLNKTKQNPKHPNQTNQKNLQPLSLFTFMITSISFISTV